MRRFWFDDRAAFAAFVAIVVLLVAVGVLAGTAGEKPRSAAARGGAAGVQTTARAPATPREALIVFGSRGDLFRVRANGKRFAPMTSGAQKDRSPEWSPDGRRVAFTREHDVWILDPADGHATRVTEGTWRDGSPSWSPDAKRIAFDRRAGDAGPFDVWVVDVQGGGREVNLTEDLAASATAPEWSADGTEIVFQSARTLWVMRADGTGKRRLLPPSDGIELAPAWSPDGRRIAYAEFSLDQRRSDIYVVDVDGTDARNVTRGRAQQPNWPAWSADGKSLVFADRSGVWVVGADGRGLRRVVRGGPYGSPTWSAPGTA